MGREIEVTMDVSNGWKDDHEGEKSRDVHRGEGDGRPSDGRDGVMVVRGGLWCL